MIAVLIFQKVKAKERVDLSFLIISPSVLERQTGPLSAEELKQLERKRTGGIFGLRANQQLREPKPEQLSAMETH